MAHSCSSIGRGIQRDSKIPPKHSTQHPSVADPSVSDTSTDPIVAADLFDSRPGGDTREKSVFDRMRETLAHFSERCREASEWLQQKWAGLSHGTGIELHIGQISMPRSFKQRELPNEILHELRLIDAEKRKASAEVAFIQSLDLIPKEVPSDKDVDEQAFETYTKLCRQEGKQLGTISCPHNFNDAAVRYAKVFIGQVEKRKATAEQTQAEFWLSSADQEKFEGAKLLLAQQDDPESKKLAEAASQLGQVQKNSSHHYLSFMAWREWRNDMSKKPTYEQFSIDAALAYASELQRDYAGKDIAADSQVKALLSDAAALFANKDLHTELYNSLLMLEQIWDSIADLRASEPDFKAAPDSVSTTSLPAPPPPRSRTQHAPTLATLYKIPDLSTFDPEVQAIGYARLNQFFDDYNASLDKGNVRIDRKDIFFTPTVAAAVDFLDKSNGSPEGVDWQMFAAANFLVSEYRLHQEEIRSKN